MELSEKKRVRRLLRQARLIEQRYQSLPATSFHGITTNFTTELVKNQYWLRFATEKKWFVAAAHLRNLYQNELERLQNGLTEWSQQNQNQSQFTVNRIDIVRDLLALQDEFASFEFQTVGRLLSVTTEPIELEGTHLGAFQICLDVGSLCSQHNGQYDVIAIDANPASSDENVTHPHVQSDQLCEGDAQSAIRLALRQGRLFDFFQLVENVLRTYNSSSAYVSLNDWGDLTCSDCGHLTTSGDCDTCSVCEGCVCDSCWCTCGDCDERHCGGCNIACSGCLEDVCKSCVNQCNECSENFCSDCLKDEERCNSCEKQNTEAEEQNDTDDVNAEVHADSLGEAAVPT